MVSKHFCTLVISPLNKNFCFMYLAILNEVFLYIVFTCYLDIYIALQSNSILPTSVKVEMVFHSQKSNNVSSICVNNALNIKSAPWEKEVFTPNMNIHILLSSSGAARGILYVVK